MCLSFPSRVASALTTPPYSHQSVLQELLGQFSAKSKFKLPYHLTDRHKKDRLFAIFCGDEHQLLQAAPFTSSSLHFLAILIHLEVLVSP